MSISRDRNYWMTQDEFDHAVSALEMSDENIERARRVLVENEAIVHVASDTGCAKMTVSNHMYRIANLHEILSPDFNASVRRGERYQVDCGNSAADKQCDHTSTDLPWKVPVPFPPGFIEMLWCRDCGFSWNRFRPAQTLSRQQISSLPSEANESAVFQNIWHDLAPVGTKPVKVKEAS